MKNRILPLLLLLVVCISLLGPVWASDITPLDPDADARLTLYYQKDGDAFADLEIGIYRIAQAFPDGTFELVQPYAFYPLNIHDITVQEQWQQNARTLYAYIVANQAEPDREARTDADGTVCFSDLETGLYFVREAAAIRDGGTYLFNHFLVYVPTPHPDGSYDYAVEARPKCTNFVPRDQYTVTKLWQDAGKQDARPGEITVDIYQNGEWKDTQILSAANNWTYTWQVSGEDSGQWTVAERDVPEPYRVAIQQNGNTFSIVNVRHTPTEIPYTGDSFSPLPYILVMCFSGVMLVILGIYHWRRKG